MTAAATIDAKLCSACGAPFGCSAHGPGRCWCAALPPMTPSPGADCLCPNCLKAHLFDEAERAGEEPDRGGTSR